MRMRGLIRGWREGRRARRDPERLAALTEPITLSEGVLMQAAAEQDPEPCGQPLGPSLPANPRAPSRPRGLMLVVWVLLLPLSLLWWPAAGVLGRLGRERRGS